MARISHKYYSVSKLTLLFPSACFSLAYNPGHEIETKVFKWLLNDHWHLMEKAHWNQQNTTSKNALLLTLSSFAKLPNGLVPLARHEKDKAERPPVAAMTVISMHTGNLANMNA